MAITDVVILAAKRTAIGSFGGSLARFTPAELGTFAAKAAVAHAAVDVNELQHAVFGHIITTAAQDVYLARHIALNIGMPASSAALNVNRLCGSGLQAVISAAQQIMLGDSQLVLAGGAESMSNGAYLLPGMRRGQRLGDGAVQDLTLGILSDPFGSGHMGITAENIAKQYGFSREQLDQYALQSQQRAAAAQANGAFTGQIVPVPLALKGAAAADKPPSFFQTDEHLRHDCSLSQLAQLKPAFQRDGLVTAGNASGLNDGAAALVLAHQQYATQQGLTAQARLLGYAVAGVEPSLMGLGPIPAVQKLLAQTGVSLSQIDVIESNEAFAAQALAVAQTLQFNPAKVNPHGGAIALGHPVGATGAMLLVKALSYLQHSGGRLGLVTLCIGGGQGIALLFERLGD